MSSAAGGDASSMASLKSGLPSGAPKECNQNKPPIQRPAAMARRVMRGRNPLRLDWNDMAGVAFYQFGLIEGPAAWAATPPQDNYPTRPDFRTPQAQILENAKFSPFFFGLGYGARRLAVAATPPEPARTFESDWCVPCSGYSKTAYGHRRVGTTAIRTTSAAVRSGRSRTTACERFSFYPKGATSGLRWRIWRCGWGDFPAERLSDASRVGEIGEFSAGAGRLGVRYLFAVRSIGVSNSPDACWHVLLPQPQPCRPG